MSRRPLLPLLALAALLALPPACRALSCYRCSGTSLQSGADSTNSSGAVSLVSMTSTESVGTSISCSSFDPSQSKYQMRCSAPFDKSCAKNVRSDGEAYERGCANGAGTECTKFGDIRQCLCMTNFCNSAGLTTPALLLLLPAALLAALYSRQ